MKPIYIDDPELGFYWKDLHGLPISAKKSLVFANTARCLKCGETCSFVFNSDTGYNFKLECPICGGELRHINHLILDKWFNDTFMERVKNSPYLDLRGEYEL